jgi:hypothetical protein
LQAQLEQVHTSRPQLAQPVSPSLSVLWLIAALLLLAAAGLLFVWPRWWWVIGACTIVVSLVAIVPSWTDAKFGALTNLIALVGVIFGFLAQGPTSLRRRTSAMWIVRWRASQLRSQSGRGISPISLFPCGGISARPASSGSRASTTFAHGCMAASGMGQRDDGSHLLPNSTTSSTNALGAYSLHNLTANPNPDGSYTVRFGGCQKGTVNCLPIMPGWN